MMTKKPKVVIIGAGMAGLAAANKLYTAAVSNGALELCVVEGGNRIGGRINTSEFGGDGIETGATWIHGIGGSPLYRIAQETNSLESDRPWECMDGSADEKNAETIAEGGYPISSSILDSISNLFKKLMDIAAGSSSNGISESNLSLGSFLRNGLDAYWASNSIDDDGKEMQGFDGWCRKSLEDAIFAMFENTQRTYTSAGDLGSLDFAAEREYRMFPGEEITIAKGYMSILESLASVLPPGLVRLGQKVVRIEWNPNGDESGDNSSSSMPVKLHFLDGSVMFADHVIVTVSLGVLKHGIRNEASGGLFHPPLPRFKTEAISRLGFGVVNKLFLKIDPNTTQNFPHLQMVFHQQSPKKDHQPPPWWMKRTASLSPIYSNSSVILAWFAGKEAMELESLEDGEIIEGVSATISHFLPNLVKSQKISQEVCNGLRNGVKIVEVLKSQWGSDPLFLGSYSYVAVGSSGDDLDTMAEPLPANLHLSCSENASSSFSSSPLPLQILFAGEATHRTHYSTTHGAYFSGLREANRLLQHYHRSDGV